MFNGYIRLHRKFKEWEWYDDANTMRVFIHCLLNANYTRKDWHGITINRGEYLTSIRQLSNDLRLTIQQIRLSIEKLKSTNEITTKTTNSYTVIIISNYGSYQNYKNENNEQNNNQTTIKQQSNNNQTTTTNINNTNNINNINNNNTEKFDKLWDLYDKKIDKKTSKARFAHIKKTEYEALFKHVELYVRATPDKQFRKNLPTYLNSKDWLNYDSTKYLKSKIHKDSRVESMTTQELDIMKNNAAMREEERCSVEVGDGK